MELGKVVYACSGEILHMKSIERFSALLECSDETAWREMVFQLGNNFGYESTLIAVVPDTQTSLENAFLRSNYSPQWRSAYDTHKLVHVDPTVTHCVTRSTPLIWEPRLFASKHQKEMYEEASSHGLRSGVTLPFHGANGELGILCFVNDVMPGKSFQREALQSMPDISLMRDFAFEASLAYAKTTVQKPRPNMTCRELECLKWCAAGKSSWEIAQILRCSEATVNFHFGNLRRKLDATTRRQAVVKAIRIGIIHPT